MKTSALASVLILVSLASAQAAGPSRPAQGPVPAASKAESHPAAPVAATPSEPRKVRVVLASPYVNVN